MVQDPVTRHLVTALTDWAHGTGARVIAEGLETVSQALALRECGVDAGQGYLWARPMPGLTSVTPQLGTRL